MAGLNCISFLMTASKISYSSWHGDGLFNLRDQELCIISQASDIPREVGGGGRGLVGEGQCREKGGGMGVFPRMGPTTQVLLAFYFCVCIIIVILLPKLHVG